jgi:hypothetical protein
MRIIAIVKCSAGNDSVGEMWVETMIFDETATLKDVMAWFGNDIKKNITLSIAQE